VKLDNLWHPLQTARTAKRWFATHVHMWKFGNHGQRRFHDDPRYNLRYVSRGFADHIDDAGDDIHLLSRICAAYNEATAQQHSGHHAYTTVESWDRLRQGRLAPSIRALRENDAVTLQKMYRNFYRDPCSAGLLGAPGGMPKAYFGGHIKDIYRHFYLSHVLYRLDYWNEITAGRFSLKDLSGPGIGNPFGVTINGTHICVGVEYSHYCAQRVAGLIDRSAAKHPAVAEIGGGFGAIAYYLLRDHRPLTYFNFDLPERIALSSYYLMKAFPHLKFLLYGEEPLVQETISQADVVLMPTAALAAMPSASVDITFSSSGMADLSPDAIDESLRRIVAITRRSLLYIGNERSSERIAGHVGKEQGPFALAERRTSGWHSHKVSGAGVGGAAALAASTLLEQTFSRKVAPPDLVAGARTLSREEGVHAVQQ